MNKNEDNCPREWREALGSLSKKPRGQGKVGDLGKFGSSTERVLRNPHTHTHTLHNFPEEQHWRCLQNLPPFPSPLFVSREEEGALLELQRAKKS